MPTERIMPTERTTPTERMIKPRSMAAKIFAHQRSERMRATTLPKDELVELRAAQRTFEGSYVRTSLSQFSFSLVILKIFTSEFYSIGALLAVYGAAILAVSAYRRHEGNGQFFAEVTDDGVTHKRFRTSGNVVLILSALSFAAYICLLVLTLRLDSKSAGGG